MHTLKSLIYRLECAIGNREFACGRFSAELTWQSVGFGWRGSFRLWACREWPGVSVNLIAGDEWYSMRGFERIPFLDIR